MINVVAKVPVKDGKADDVIDLFKDLMTPVAEEEGTLFYRLNRDPSNPNMIVILERYRDKAALDAHASTPHFKALFSRMPEFLAGQPEISILKEIHAIS